MNMIERVARAIVGTTGEFNFDTDVEMRETFLREARNAIEATREWALASMKDHPFAEAWSDVVDAALKE